MPESPEKPKANHVQPHIEVPAASFTPAPVEVRRISSAEQKKSSIVTPERPQKKPKNNNRMAELFVAVLLGAAIGLGGAWGLLASGVVDFGNTIDANREKIVLQEGEIVAEVFKKVSPSTVSITTTSQRQEPLNRFMPSQISEGAGSGIIISADGYVMTNRHVVPEDVGAVTVIMHDGTEYKDVRVVGRDPFNDIAFLKINGAQNLTPAQFGDSSAVEAGQKVVAIGNALGQFRNSVTSGIISGIGRPIEAQGSSGESEKLENLFQTDAAINPGNSGGPLVNLKGEVIGINTAISEEGQAIGFAIPTNDAKGLMKSVIETGKVVKPYLGVRYVGLDPDIAASRDLPVKEGALIIGSASQPGVMPDSPAAKAGLREGDVILKVNGSPVTAQTSLAGKLGQFAPGDKVELIILRDKQEQKVEVTLEAYSQ